MSAEGQSPGELDETALVEGDPVVVTAPARRPPGPAADAMPHRIGRYVILRELGRGAMGVVYAGYDERLERKVAVKVVSNLSGTGETRVLREAQALARLSDPNVVAIYEADEWAGGVYIAMEFIDGQTLRAWSGIWEEALAMHLQAARGLAAAHRAGIVHRDFKPDNALVGRDGRVRVVDFGLARGANDDPPVAGAAIEPREVELAATTTPLSSDLTRTGALVGTPAYMSPEQYAGQAASPRSDQFALCVSLYEALFGRRPFAGSTAATVGYNVMKGKPRPVPSGTRVPTHVKTAVLRGLSAAPEDRFPDLDALITALEYDPRVRRRRWVGAGLVLTTASLLAFAPRATQPELATADPCTEAAAAMDDSWSDARREAIRSAFAETGLAYAADTTKRLLPRLDTYGAAWREGALDACRSTHVRRTQSDAMLDARMSCLERARRQFDALAQAYETPSPDTVKSALRSFDGLPDLDHCQDGSSLLDGFSPPTDPGAARRVEDARGDLAEARALSDAMQFDTARRKLDSIREALMGVDHPPITAELELATARLERAGGNYEEAREAAHAAYFAALRARDDDLATRAAGSIVDISLEHLSDREHAERWRPHAKSFFDRLRARGPLDSRLLLLEIITHDDGTDESGTDARFAAAITRLESEPGRGLLLSSVLNKRGGRALGKGDFEAAADYWARTEAINARELGERHPHTSLIRVNRAVALSYAGEREEAAAAFEQSRDALQGVLPDDHPYFASIANNLAAEYVALGRLDEALETQQDALRRYRDAYGEAHMKIAGALSVLGDIELARGDLDAAIEHLDEAQQMWADHGTYRDGRVRILVGLGDALQVAGRWEEARDAYTRADAIMVEVHGELDWRRHLPLRGRGEVELRRDHRSAVKTLQLADELASSGTPDPADLARLRAARARAHHATGELEMARRLGRQAIDGFARAPAGYTSQKETFEAWAAVALADE